MEKRSALGISQACKLAITLSYFPLARLMGSATYLKVTVYALAIPRDWFLKE
jgi:hypothetical protein